MRSSFRDQPKPARGGDTNYARSYFAKFLATKGDAIDYGDLPPTTEAD